MSTPPPLHLVAEPEPVILPFDRTGDRTGDRPPVPPEPPVIVIVVFVRPVN
jgi:hypothetical protein